MIPNLTEIFKSRLVLVFDIKTYSGKGWSRMKVDDLSLWMGVESNYCLPALGAFAISRQQPKLVHVHGNACAQRTVHSSLHCEQCRLPQRYFHALPADSEGHVPATLHRAAHAICSHPHRFSSLLRLIFLLCWITTVGAHNSLSYIVWPLVYEAVILLWDYTHTTLYLNLNLFLLVLLDTNWKS